MAGFDPIDLGSVADDRTGDDFRAGGTKINIARIRLPHAGRHNNNLS